MDTAADLAADSLLLFVSEKGTFIWLTSVNRNYRFKRDDFFKRISWELMSESAVSDTIATLTPSLDKVKTWFLKNKLFIVAFMDYGLII